MANAFCVTCIGVVSWSGTRGTKLSLRRCPRCRGRLRAATGDETLYAPQIRGDGEFTDPMKTRSQ